MQHILLLGIGRSTYYLLQYLHDVLIPKGVQVTAVDIQENLITKRRQEFPRIEFLQSEIDKKSILPYIQKAEIVISMLPPAFHTMVAELCLQENKHFFTASYVSPEIKALSEQAKKQDLLFMMECGLDPGIDHMSAIALIHQLQAEGADISSFESYTGGLIHPAYTNPPWNYKVSWNPRNVVLAGQGADAQYKEGGLIKMVPYQQLFTKPSAWRISKTDQYEGYPNRDSLRYQELYQLEQAKTFIRGTLRYPGYCEGWNYLLQLGLTDDTIILPEDKKRIARSFLTHFLPDGSKTIEEKLYDIFSDHAVSAIIFIRALGLLHETPILSTAATPAQILQSIIEKEWKLNPRDKDRIVMIHRVTYQLKGLSKTIQSSLLVDGEDAERTAMAKTVGLPLAVAVDLFLSCQITSRGVVIPITEEIYKPILKKLEAFDIVFKESKV
jgi:saccharopine dehydrogenase-like NADP-dependent oxidoreductase